MPTEAPRRSIGAKRNPESERAILDAARDLLAEKGLAGFSIEAVARRAHAGKPTIYRWWPDKARLLLAVYAGVNENLLDPDTGSLEGDIAGFFVNVMAYWRDTPAGNIFRSVMAESQSDAEAHRALTEYHVGRRLHVAALFGRDYGDGQRLDAVRAAQLAEIAACYAMTQLLMGTLDHTEADLNAVAQTLAQGARS